MLKCVQTHVSKLHLTRLCVGCIYMGGRMCICNFVDIGGYFGNIKFPSSQSHGEIYVWFEEFKIIQIKDMDHSDNMSMVIGGSDR